MLIVTAVFAYNHNVESQDSYMYSYYKADLVSGSKTKNTVGILNNAYRDRCVAPVDKQDNNLLALRMNVTTNSLVTNTIALTWAPRRASFIHYDAVNGYGILALIFGLTAFFETISFYSLPVDTEKHHDFTKYPCAWRWMEYSITAPLMILLIGSALMIRDVYTLYMLMLAQVAICQFGFAVEFAIGNKHKDEPKDSIKLSELVGFIDFTEGINDDGLPNLTNRLFWFSFSPSMTLHIGIWVVLFGSFLNQENLSCNTTDLKANDNWKTALLMVIAIQAFGFSCFAFIPIVQAIKVKIIGYKSGLLCCFLPMCVVKQDEKVSQELCEETLQMGFSTYTIINAIVKVILGITYISFVRMFPFSTYIPMQ